MDKYNLWHHQLFADEPAPTAEPAGAPTETAGTPPETPAQPPAGAPTFAEMLRANKAYQAEHDRIVAKAIKTSQDKASATQTDMEKMAAQLKALQDRADRAERQAAVAKAGIDPRYAKFVEFEAAENVSDTTDFAAALSAYLTANPQYLTRKESAPGDPAAQTLLQTLGSMNGKTADNMTDAEYFQMRRQQAKK